MKKYIEALIKKKWILYYTLEKRSHLFSKNGRIPGLVLCIIFNKLSTFFEVSDFVKTSKKQRSNIVEVQVKDIFQYNYLGLCMAHKKDEFDINVSYITRNAIDRVPYESTIMLFSPVIEAVDICKFINKLKYINHNKYYFLRDKPLPLSTIFFDYVTDMSENEVVIEKEIEMSEII